MIARKSNPGLPRRPEVILAAIAFLMRIGFMLAQHTYQFPITRNHFAFGFETGSIAGAIARGEGFSSPFGATSGPTAWIGPIYPYLLAGIFKVFGLFTDTSAIAILTVNSLFAALTCYIMFLLAEELFDRRAAYIAAGLWAVLPFFFRYAITWVWDSPISAFLISLGILLAIRLRDGSRRDWLRFGALAGISALVNPALTTLFPVLMVWAVWNLGRRGTRSLAPAIMGLAVMGACISPWLLRNRIVFGQWVFLRSNAPFEFSLGNFPGSPGVPYAGAAPAVNPYVFNEYLQMGEIAFVKAKGAKAMMWVKSHPGDFAKLTVKRVADFWDGAELNYEPLSDPWRPWMISLESGAALFGLLRAGLRRVPNIGPIALTLLLYPLPYYVVYTSPRYRHAIEPLLVVLIGYFVVSVYDEIWNAKRVRNQELASVAR